MASQSKVIKSNKIDQDVSLEARLNMKDPVNNNMSSNHKVISHDELGAIDKGKHIIDEALAKAKSIKENAKEIYLQVEEKMEEARKKGFEKGKEEGLASVTEQLVLIQKQNQEILAKIEQEALSLVYEIAHKVVGDNLKTSDEALLGMMRHALQSAMGNELTLFIHPNDYKRIKNQESQLMASAQAIQTIHIKPSENVLEGGCVIESELGTIDAQLENQLEAIRNALGVEKREPRITDQPVDNEESDTSDMNDEIDDNDEEITVG